MNAGEQAVAFSCHGDRMIGIVHRPRAAAKRGVVIVVGGPQYRIGSHRQFVLLARALAAAGYAVLRFDHRGIGDSGGTFSGFETIDDDIAAAVDTLQRECPVVEDVVLWGLCGAASAVMLYAFSDPRVGGVALANPWVRGETSLARVHLTRHYRRRIRDSAFWRKLASGGVDLRAAARAFVRTLRLALGFGTRAIAVTANRDGALVGVAPGFVARMCEGLARFDGRVLLILSGKDITAKEFDQVAHGSADWRRTLGAERVRKFHLASADYTFATREWRDAVAAATVEWLQSW